MTVNDGAAYYDADGGNDILFFEAIESGYKFQARSEETVTSTHFFCRIKNKQYNFSNNNTFYTASDGTFTNDDFFNDIGSKFMSFESAQCFMDLETKKGVRTFASQDTRLLVRDGPKGGQGTIYDFQIKANSSSKLDNLKYEPTQHGASAARMGKATVEYVENLLKLYVGDKFKKSNSDPEYARNADTFADQKTKWVNRIDNLILKGVTVQSEKYNGTKLDGEACYDKIMTVFGTQYWVANSKLMQISWLSLVMSLQGNNTDSNAGDQLDEFCTDMVYLASKAGPRYGPFAKIY